jgi:hypothetical protein
MGWSYVLNFNPYVATLPWCLLSVVDVLCDTLSKMKKNLHMHVSPIAQRYDPAPMLFLIGYFLLFALKLDDGLPSPMLLLPWIRQYIQEDWSTRMEAGWLIPNVGWMHTYWRTRGLDGILPDGKRSQETHAHDWIWLQKNPVVIYTNIGYLNTILIGDCFNVTARQDTTYRG